MTPTTPLRCETYAATNPAHSCAARALARFWGRAASEPRYPVCSRCRVGLRAAQALTEAGWTPRPDFSTDLRKQREARRTDLLSHPEAA